MLQDATTSFVARLRARDPAAWFELWETFGPVLRSQLARWGRGRIGVETVKDLSQETLTALASAIDRHDPSKGARFSTWLLAIARYTLGDEIDRRMAQKRGGGIRAQSLAQFLEGDPGQLDGRTPDDAYEQSIFDAKVESALRATERESDLIEFTIYRQRVLEGRTGREVAQSLGTSEPTVSRRLATVRGRLRARLAETFAKYSFTPEEMDELRRNGIELNPKKNDDTRFDDARLDDARLDDARLDDAIGEIYHRFSLRAASDTAAEKP